MDYAFPVPTPMNDEPPNSLRSSLGVGEIYACLQLSATRELQIGPLATFDEALLVEQVMRERVAELIAADDLIDEVDGVITGIEQWDQLSREVVREALARVHPRSG